MVTVCGYLDNNTGKEGGALSLLESRLHLNSNSTTVFDRNKANYGGVIFATPYYSYADLKDFPLCTLGLPNYGINVSTDFKVLVNISVYSDTQALYTGNTIFYGAFEQCLHVSFVTERYDLLVQTNLQGVLFPSQYIPSSLILCGASRFLSK